MKQDRQCTYNITLRRGDANTVAVEKQQVLHILGGCVTLGIQHAMFFSALSQKGHSLGGGGDAI